MELVERGDVVGFDESFDGQFHDQRMWAVCIISIIFLKFIPCVCD